MRVYSGKLDSGSYVCANNSKKELVGFCMHSVWKIEMALKPERLLLLLAKNVKLVTHFAINPIK